MSSRVSFSFSFNSAGGKTTAKSISKPLTVHLLQTSASIGDTSIGLSNWCRLVTQSKTGFSRRAFSVETSSSVTSWSICFFGCTMLLGLSTGLNISLDVITVILSGSYCIHPGFTSLLNWKHPESIWLSSSRGSDIEREKREPTGQKRTFWFSFVCAVMFSVHSSAWYRCRIDPTGCKARVWLTETHQPCFYWFVYTHSLNYVTFSYHLWNQNYSLSAAWLVTWAQSARELSLHVSQNMFFFAQVLWQGRIENSRLSFYCRKETGFNFVSLPTKPLGAGNISFLQNNLVAQFRLHSFS